MARPRRLLALAAATLATALAACSLLTGLDADYKLQPSSEAGRDGEVEPEGGLDAGTDTSPLLDGGGDSTTDARYCERNGDAANVVFCCDFEQTEVACTWDGDERTNGTLVEEDGVGKDGSRGLHATVLKGPASLYVRRQRGAPFNAMSKHELSFAFSVKTKSTLYGAELGALGFGLPLKVIGVSVYQAAGKDAIDVSDPPGMLTGSRELVAKGEWRRATITMDRADGGPCTTTIKVTGESGTTQTEVDSRIGYDGGAALPQLLVGAFFTSPEADGGVETVIDDVLFTQTK